MTNKTESYFDKLSKIDVSKKIETKKDLKYLSWSCAWTELMKIYPAATYEIMRYNNNLPYVYDEATGYMVFTKMTIENVTHEMWLPVMNMANKAMKNKAYSYKTKFGNKEVEAASMFDINKTIMRCLVKNMAMFGLALYIYAGEDLPDVPNEEDVKETREIWNEKQYNELKSKIKAVGDLQELEDIFLNSKQTINTLKKYAPSYYADLIFMGGEEKRGFQEEEKGGRLPNLPTVIQPEEVGNTLKRSLGWR